MTTKNEYLVTSRYNFTTVEKFGLPYFPLSVRIYLFQKSKLFKLILWSVLYGLVQSLLNVMLLYWKLCIYKEYAPEVLRIFECPARVPCNYWYFDAILRESINSSCTEFSYGAIRMAAFAAVLKIVMLWSWRWFYNDRERMNKYKQKNVTTN